VQYALIFWKLMLHKMQNSWHKSAKSATWNGFLNM